MRRKRLALLYFSLSLIILFFLSAGIPYLFTKNPHGESLGVTTQNQDFSQWDGTGVFSATQGNDIRNFLVPNGIQYNLMYNGSAATANQKTILQLYPALAQIMITNHVGLIDGSIKQFEQAFMDPSGNKGNYANEQYYLSQLDSYLKTLSNDPNVSVISGFWILDDQVSPGASDNGNGQKFLQDVHSELTKYFPGKPAICGFGQFFGLKNGQGFSDVSSKYKDFSNKGCDMPAIYVYAHVGNSSNAGDYDWTMGKIVANAKKELQDPNIVGKGNEWDPNTQPLIGIPMAFGGQAGSDNFVQPTGNEVRQQIDSFCLNNPEVEGIIAYSYRGSQYSISYSTTTPSLAWGVTNGIQDCKQKWQSALTVTPPKPPTSQAYITFTLLLDGIYNAGDRITHFGGNKLPRHTKRSVHISILSGSKVLTSKTTECTYTIPTGNFSCSLFLPILPGSYTMLVDSKGYLENNETIQIKSGIENVVPSLFLITGSASGNKDLSILDYNVLRSCYGETAPTMGCPDPSAADFNDDGVVDGIDYNIFLREWSYTAGVQ